MNQNDINRMFTEKVTELIAQGYQINPATMSGSQGEYAHVDLRKGTEIIRVLLDDAIFRTPHESRIRRRSSGPGHCPPGNPPGSP